MTILLEKKDAIATITLNRPRAFNCLDGILVAEALDILGELEKDNAIRVVVLSGEGIAFCAGGDLNYIREKLSSPADASIFVSQVGAMIKKLHNLHCPTIAMVGGVAAGAGANLALACDLIYCSSSARFGQSFAKVGLIPDAGGHYFLPRAVGMARAKELMFTGALLNAASALEMGLVNRVLDDDKLSDAVYALAAELAAGPPLALAAIKRNLNFSPQSSLDQMLSLETAEQSIAIFSEDGREGMTAFCEKRSPIFKGR